MDPMDEFCSAVKTEKSNPTIGRKKKKEEKKKKLNYLPPCFLCLGFETRGCGSSRWK
jgi:hypothetical protein